MVATPLIGYTVISLLSITFSLESKATETFECDPIDLKLFARNLAIKAMCLIAFAILLWIVYSSAWITKDVSYFIRLCVCFLLGPGPGRYGLPSMLGHENHDCRRIKNPAYSFGHRLENSSKYKLENCDQSSLYHCRCGVFPQFIMSTSIKLMVNSLQRINFGCLYVFSV